jgi:hypothetical protein
VLELDELLAATVAAYFAHLDMREPWRRDAACKEHVAAFFPVRGKQPTVRRDGREVA